eukprot:c2061_g1_i1.p1 GENE.c2061_g1_i1~~c2061_g1_i1.p1  ORF type:complete len:277 (+),score=99.18 c2061_g1_i1:125-832(+)
MENFLPLVCEIVTYAAAIVPTALTPRHSHSAQFDALLQTSSLSGHNSTTAYENLKSANSTVEEMMGMGRQIEGLLGYNPMDMMTDLIGKDGLVEVVDNITMFSKEFPDTVSEEQVQFAEMMILTLGVFGPDSSANANATEKFLGSLSHTQSDMLFKLQHNVLERLMSVMSNPDGTPSQKLIDETELQMHKLEKSPVMTVLNGLLGSVTQDSQQQQQVLQDDFESLMHTSKLLQLL